MDRDEILAIYAHGPEAVVVLVEALLARQETLQARVQVLEDRLAKDSHNSHQPPSRDLPPKPKSLRERSGRKPGGQPGHPGMTLAWSPCPDHVVVHQPTTCAACGTALSGSAVVGQARRQVVELPELRLVTTEHVAKRQQCPACGQVTQAAFPLEAGGGVRYGPRLRGLAVYLRAYHLLPAARIQELLADLFGCSFSAGTLATVVAGCHDALAASETAIHTALQQAAVAHFDETGLRVTGPQQWLHVASTASRTHYGVHRQRGTAGMQALGVLPSFRGVAVHDGYTAYGTFGCQHALCNVHHLRELTFVAAQHEQDWANDLKALLCQMKDAVEHARATGHRRLAPATVADYETRYRALALTGLEANPLPEKVPGKPGPPKRSTGGKLAERLGHHETAVLRFLHDFCVPFDNNQAERDIRMVKVQQKISGGFRTATGAAQFCRIRGYLSTTRKQGHAPLLALQAACAGAPLALA